MNTASYLQELKNVLLIYLHLIHEKEYENYRKCAILKEFKKIRLERGFYTMQIKPYVRMVFYHETDRMDIVNHSNYVHMMEEARVDFMNQIGVGYDTMEKKGIMLPVLGISCQYKHSLRFGEHLAVYSYITKYNGFKLELRYEIRCVESGLLCAVGTSSHCFTNTDIKPMRIMNKYPEIHSFFQSAKEVEYNMKELNSDPQ